MTGIPKTVCPPTMMNAMPLIIVRVPSVTIIGGIFTLVAKVPFRSPHTHPAAIPAKKEKGTGTFKNLANDAEITPDSATIEPTERSIPPAITTKVSPNALIPIMETCLSITMKLSNVRKARVIKEKKLIRATRKTYIPILSIEKTHLTPPLMLNLSFRFEVI